MEIRSLPVSLRVLNPDLERKIMSAEEAAALIHSGDQVGMSGFTGSGYPKAVPMQLAHRIAEATFRGQKFQVSVFTGASTGPELDGALAMAGAFTCGFPINPIPKPGSGLMLAKWSTWTFISAMSPSSWSMGFSASWMWR